ncbi:MAG: hypothetical protein HOO98_09140 [Nitrospira sp.]|nr:hypothetical protein [Nitrospira sp.]TKB93261.1 MAG: hypothetical protein E8D40_03925 [Nitrospira sp.]
MKSTHEAQAEAPVLNPQSMLALPLFVHEKRKKVANPIAFLIHFTTGQYSCSRVWCQFVHRLLAGATSTGEIGHSGELCETSRCRHYSIG